MAKGTDPKGDESMLRMEYALASADKRQPLSDVRAPEKPQVSPELKEVLHMLDALQNRDAIRKNNRR